MSQDEDIEEGRWILRVRAAEAEGDIEFLGRALEGTVVRGVAAVALARLGRGEFVPQMLRMLDASDYGVRLRGAQALGLLGEQSAVPRLRELLASDPHPSVRGIAAAALGQIGPPVTATDLLPYLDDPKLRARIGVVHGLGILGDPAAVECLRRRRRRSVLFRGEYTKALRQIDEAARSGVRDTSGSRSRQTPS